MNPMMSDNDKMAAIIVGKADGEKTPQEMDSPDAGLEAATEEIFDAIKSDDKFMLKEALKSFVSMCKEEEYEQE